MNFPPAVTNHKTQHAGSDLREEGMTVKSNRAIDCYGASLLALLIANPAAQAQQPAEFYRGKTVNVYIGVGAGGEYDIQARLVARHIGKHIPGNPSVVPQNMTGAGGLKMINFL